MNKRLTNSAVTNTLLPGILEFLLMGILVLLGVWIIEYKRVRNVWRRPPQDSARCFPPSLHPRRVPHFGRYFGAPIFERGFVIRLHEAKHFNRTEADVML